MALPNQLERLRLAVKRSLDRGEFTQTELAARVGVSQASISNFVREKRGIDRETEAGLLRALELNPRSLLDDPLPPELRVEHAIPVVSHITALSISRIVPDLILEKSGYTLGDFHGLPRLAGRSRKGWTRFVAIVVNARQARFLPRYIQKDNIVVIDRHDWRMSAAVSQDRIHPPIYAVNTTGYLSFGYLHVNSSELTIKADNLFLESLRIPLAGKDTASNLVVGRVCAASIRP